MVEGGDPVFHSHRGRDGGRGAARASVRASPSLAGAPTTHDIGMVREQARGRADRSGGHRGPPGGPGAARDPRRPLGGWGVPVAESVLAPPGPIPNPVVTQRSAGEYCGGDPTGGEAAADTPHPRTASEVGQWLRAHSSEPKVNRPSRGGAAAARWAHNP